MSLFKTKTDNPDDARWREQLTDEQYKVLREKGTERPFTGEYVHTKDDGIYRCAACGAPSPRTWSCTRTTACSCGAPRSRARTAAATSATCFRTVRTDATATASTRSR